MRGTVAWADDSTFREYGVRSHDERDRLKLLMTAICPAGPAGLTSTSTSPRSELHSLEFDPQDEFTPSCYIT